VAPFGRHAHLLRNTRNVAVSEMLDETLNYVNAVGGDQQQSVRAIGPAPAEGQAAHQFANPGGRAGSPEHGRPPSVLHRL
jgi:hypothetical protein